MAGANVKLINMTTNAERDTSTSDEGVFSFEAVQVGDYRLEVEAPGFKKSVSTDIHALIASPVTVDVKMETRQHRGVSNCFNQFCRAVGKPRRRYVWGATSSISRLPSCHWKLATCRTCSRCKRQRREMVTWPAHAQTKRTSRSMAWTSTKHRPTRSSAHRRSGRRN